MTGEQGWDRARWLWWLALAGGVSFMIAVVQRLDGSAIWAWKTSGVGFLALWAAANARSRDGWMIAAALGFGALGDWLLDAKGLETGAVAFVVGHLVAIALYLFNRRAKMTPSQRLLGWLAMPATLVIVWAVLSPAPGWWHAAIYSLFVAAMAAAAWTSRFPRYRTGIGAMLFLASDLFIFAGEGGALSKGVTMWLVWPFYFAGQALIAWGVVSTLSKEARG
ncbi:YhhN-like protein [uncultured Sphingopyxis sp.]|uniref:YhhN-like protein n=1 Tax=uncultured Sphingopyxis sp. TaxID=310581 RepID=A0A1Y5PSG8_9SPHN|nr:lysoplasmalogenase family protein [uncultured Sphingopyxis sp.]SBV32939.1 YhhN-like protein [uncultured Sphingopyxis sp.]